MATNRTIIDEFKTIDDAISKYYTNLHHEYNYDENGNGIFLQWIIKEELNDDSLPIETELGDDCDPNDCTYTSILNDIQFPMPSQCSSFTNKEKELFIFYLLKYCWKHSQPPSQQYIQQNIIAIIKPDIIFRMFVFFILPDRTINTQLFIF